MDLLTYAPKITISNDLTSTYYRIWHAKEEMVSLLSNHEDTVIFGDSTAHSGYRPEILGPHVFNFATDAATPIEAYFLLKYMVDNNKIPKNVVLSYLSSHYYHIDGNYWDSLLGFNSESISRAEAKEILSIDQQSNAKNIPAYYNTFPPQKTVSIPYYYDVAIGILKKINPDFNTYVNNYINYYFIKNIYFKSQGNGDPSIKEVPLVKEIQNNGNPYCLTPRKDISPYGNDGVVQHYLEKLVDLATKNHINVYIMGGPVAKSCVNVTSDENNDANIENLKRFKTVNFEYAHKIALPDNLMRNADHTSREGSIYFSQQVKPYFDAMP